MDVLTWPDGKKFGICLSHDVDRVEKQWWHCITHFLKEKRIYHIKTFLTLWRDNPYWNFEKIMEIEEKYNVRSTFFFLNESKKLKFLDLSTYPLALGNYNINKKEIVEVIRELDKNGWEIGLHGSYDSYLSANMLKREKAILENIVGHKIIGIRQHYLNLKIPETWIYQRKAGFKYDASFGFRRDVGFRENKILPFSPFEDNFLVIPLTIMDSALFHHYPNMKDAWNAVLKIIKFAEKNGALITVLWHQRVFNEKEFPGWSKMYEKIIQESIKRRAWFGRCIDIYEEWIENE